MRKRVNPTLNTYQEKIVVALSFSKGVNPATIVKDGVYQLIKGMDDRERDALIKLYDRMTPEERQNPTK